MADIQYRDAPVIEVRAFSGDRLIALEFCEDGQQVAEVVHRWESVDGVTFLVDDFTGVRVADPRYATEEPAAAEIPPAPAVPTDVGWE